MSRTNTAKKASLHDWHPADIKAALEKRGFSLARLSRLNGYCITAAKSALRTPWPKMERLIAATIGVPEQEIWPTRYRPDGSPKSGRGERGIGRLYVRKDSTGNEAGNVQQKRAA